MSPFRNYDSWLEAPIQRMYAEAERELEAWAEWAEENDVDAEADDDAHPDHHLFEQWLTWAGLNDRWLDQQESDFWFRMEAEEQAAMRSALDGVPGADVLLAKPHLDWAEVWDLVQAHRERTAS